MLAGHASCSWLSALGDGVAYNREKNESLVVHTSLLTAYHPTSPPHPPLICDQLYNIVEDWIGSTPFKFIYSSDWCDHSSNIGANVVRAHANCVGEGGRSGQTWRKLHSCMGCMWEFLSSYLREFPASSNYFYFIVQYELFLPKIEDNTSTVPN